MSNDIIDSQLNSKDDDDDDDDDNDDEILNIKYWYILLSQFILSFNNYD